MGYKVETLTLGLPAAVKGSMLTQPLKKRTALLHSELDVQAMVGRHCEDWNSRLPFQRRRPC